MISLTDNDGVSFLDELKFGHEANPPLNARQQDDDADIEERIASLRSKGLLHALVITRRDGAAYVVDGNRRLAALRRMVEIREIPSDTPVPTREVPYSFAFEASLAANIERRAMHPVDEFEAFARLAHDGATPDRIATRFGWPVKTVLQRLALGELNAELRTLWRRGEITAEQAQAFTAEPSLERQLAIYEKIKADGVGTEPWRIREQIARGHFTTTMGFKLIGMKAYVFAGGRVRDDLFIDQPIVMDPDILSELVKERLDEELSVLRAAGWSWASLIEDLPRDAYAWPRLRPDSLTYDEAEVAEIAILEERLHMAGALTTIGREIEAQIEDVRNRAILYSFTKEERAQSGVIVQVRHDGKVATLAGVMRPGPKLVKVERGPAPPLREGSGLEIPSPAAIEAEQDKALPQLLTVMLARWQTQAIAAVIEEGDPVLALWILAVATARPSAIAVFIRPNGAMEGPFLGLANSAEDDDALVRKLMPDGFVDADDVMFSHIKAAVAASVDTARWIDARDGGVPSTLAAVDRLVGMLSADRYSKQVLLRFDPEQYFVNARRAHSEQALKEMGVVNIPAASAPKGDVARMAITHARLFDWVPEALRHPQKPWKPR